MRTTIIIALLVTTLGGGAPAVAQTNTQDAVELSNGTKVPQNPSLPKLNLTNAQREQIRKAVLNKHTTVEFQLKATKSAKGFTPAVGKTLPKGITGNALPAAVQAQIPEMRQYLYVKMKNQVLIVNGMTHRIMDTFSVTQPIS